MRKHFLNKPLIALILIASAALSCKKEPVPCGETGVEILFSDAIAMDTKSGSDLHVDHEATAFPVNTDIFVCIDYYRKDNTSPSKLPYVHGAQFTKKSSSNVFASPYSIVWLEDYYFDMYAVYPYDVKVRDVEYPENPKTTYHVVRDVGYTTKPQYLYEGKDKDDNDIWYVTSGATIVSTEPNATPAVEASDPHDLITSMVFTRDDAPDVKHITNGTQYTDHGADPVKLRFMHRLSRLEPYFVNGMGDAEEVFLKGIAIYPTITKASFAVKRHQWIPRETQDRFRYENAQWYYKKDDDPEVCIDDATKWKPYFDDAPLKYELEVPFKLTSATAVMAQDKVDVDGVGTINPYIEFRMLPDSDIDCMILHFKINDTEDAYLPVMIDKSKNQDRDFLTQMGHTTRLVLSYKATMITLLYVNYKEWESLPGRFVVGNVSIE